MKRIPKSVRTELISIAICFILAALIPLMIPGIHRTDYINFAFQLHDTYFIFNAIYPILFLCCILYNFWCQLRIYIGNSNRLITASCLITGLLIIAVVISMLVNAPLIFFVNNSALDSGGWTVYPPLSAIPVPMESPVEEGISITPVGKGVLIVLSFYIIQPFILGFKLLFRRSNS